VVTEGLQNYLADDSLAWLLDADGRWTRVESAGETAYDAQATLLHKLASVVG